MKRSKVEVHLTLRLRFLQALLLLAAIVLLWRLVNLNTAKSDFLKEQGHARFLRDVEIAANRGTITDRNGEVVAVSTPVESIWVNPQQLQPQDQRHYPALAALLEIDRQRLTDLIARRSDKTFVYLKRHLSPAIAARIVELGIEGLYTQREYHRYYPMAEIASHVVGFTDIDDRGQEGLELLLNERLQGKSGLKRVIRDRLGRTIENVESLEEVEAGEDIRLTLDRRIQYLAYRELKAAVQLHEAKGGMAIVYDSDSGEVLAMVNQPAYNPNNRSQLTADALRNRAVTDIFEPGSTMKPFTVAAALESGLFSSSSTVDTAPGYLRLANFTIRDARNYGVIDLATVIKKSSNVGASKIAMTLDREQMWRLFDGFGFGWSSGSRFPGEQSGNLPPHYQWQSIRQATISYGYGLSTTLMQLTRAYGALAAEGRLSQVTFLADETMPSRRVVSAAVARSVVTMMSHVTDEGGTARLARIEGYQIAGKTGTVRKLDTEGYNEENYLALFAGMAPANDPKLVMITVIDQPDSGDYYGGVVAAPVFAKVMGGALRLLNIPPDDVEADSSLQLTGLKPPELAP
ncbi:penicillin-binding protein 2 [Ectothiorhodospiraceae bacterium BW-2]|nr:penicillin-binding protein 2 [Ectothiorhodospiraceae bacterium BW-2]